MVSLNEVITEISNIGDNETKTKELEELTNILTFGQTNKISTIEELKEYIDKFDKFKYRYYFGERYSSGFYMSNRAALKLTDFIVNECLNENIRHNEEAIKIIFNSYFITHEIDADWYRQGLSSAYKDLLIHEEYTKEEIANKVVKAIGKYATEEFNVLYDYIVPNDLKEDPEFIRMICRIRPSMIAKMAKTKIKDKELGYQIIDENADKVIQYYPLPDYLREYVDKNNINIDKTIDRSSDKIQWIENNVKSNLYEKLYKRFGKSFLEKNKDNEKKDDKIYFMYRMLSSNVLEKIYMDNYFTKNDIDFIKSFLNVLEEDLELREQYPTDTIRNSMEFYRKKYSIIALEIFNSFVRYQKNDEGLQKLTEAVGINKNNAFQYVILQKYWDKTQKEFILTLLSSYYKLGNILTVYDIIDLMEEMSERHLTKEEILEEKNINVKYFNKVYDQVRETNPELFELIRNKFKENKIRGFKKYLLLYNSIMSSKITDYNTFVEKFKRTPEEILDMFQNSEFYEDLFKKLSSWYEFNKEENKPAGVAI